MRHAPPAKGPSICANTDVIEMGTADAAVLAVVERALDPELLADLYGLIFAPEPTRCSSS